MGKKTKITGSFVVSFITALTLLLKNRQWAVYRIERGKQHSMYIYRLNKFSHSNVLKQICRPAFALLEPEVVGEVLQLHED
jgi:hypothetical protein